MLCEPRIVGKVVHHVRCRTAEKGKERKRRCVQPERLLLDLVCVNYLHFLQKCQRREVLCIFNK